MHRQRDLRSARAEQEYAVIVGILEEFGKKEVLPRQANQT